MLKSPQTWDPVFYLHVPEAEQEPPFPLQEAAGSKGEKRYMDSHSSEAFQHQPQEQFQDPYQDPFQRRAQDPMSPHTPPHLPGSDHANDSSHAFLPDSLKGAFPAIWILILEKNNRIVLQVTLYAIAFLTLFATIIGSPHQGEWLAIITAALAPVALTFWYILFPLNPYQTYFFTKQGMKDMDHNNRGASEFVSVLGSPEAGGFLWKRAQRLLLIFFVPLLVISLVMHKLPHWAVNASWLVRVPFFFVLLFAIFRIEMFDWALRTMKSKE